jgi:hypothetical protein
MTYSPLMSRQAIRPNATQRRQRNYKFKTVEAILPKVTYVTMYISYIIQV